MPRAFHRLEPAFERVIDALVHHDTTSTDASFPPSTDRASSPELDSPQLAPPGAKQGLPQELWEISGLSPGRTIAVVDERAGHHARRLKRLSCFGTEDLADLRSEIWCGVLERVHLFDPRRAGFSTFVDRVSSNVAVTKVRQATRLKRGGGARPESVEAAEAGGGALTEADGARAHARRDVDQVDAYLLRETVRHVVDGLPDEMQGTARSLMNGTPAEVGRARGVSRHRMREDLQVLKEAFTIAGFEAEFDAPRHDRPSSNSHHEAPTLGQEPGFRPKDEQGAPLSTP